MNRHQHCVGGRAGEVDRKTTRDKSAKCPKTFAQDCTLFCARVQVDLLIFFIVFFKLRHWIVLDEKGNFITQRKDPKLALVVPRFEDGKYICLDAPGMETLKLNIQLRVDQREYKRIK